MKGIRTSRIGSLAIAMIVLVCGPGALASENGTTFRRTDQKVTTPATVWHNGRKLPLVQRTAVDERAAQAVEINIDRPLRPNAGQAKSSGLRAPLDATYTFYEQPYSGFYDSSGQSWGTWYDLVLPSGGVSVVTEIYLSGIVNAQPEGTGATYDPAIALVEMYEGYDENVASTTPVHSEWLGGLACSFGSMAPQAQSGSGYFQAEPGTYFFTTGNLDAGPGGLPRKFISLQTGTIENQGGFDRFVSFAGQSGTLGYTFTYGPDPVVGDTRDSFCMDGWGLGIAGDRIYERRDCFIWYGQASRLGLGLYGELAVDCNCDLFADGDQVACGDELGVPACESGSCGWGADCVTTDGLFCDPLDIGYVVDAACDADPDNGIPDTCDLYDCNSNGVPDGNEIAAGSSLDCDANNIPDECQIDKDSTAPGGPFYCDPTLVVGCVPICDPDCNNNGKIDICDTADNPGDPFYADCNGNWTLDGCEIASGAQPDCDENGVLDRCERPFVFDCDKNGSEDFCDIYAGLANDYDGNGIPDSCPGAVCNSRWDGFEPAEYIANMLVDGFDSDGDGNTWTQVGDTGAWRPVSCFGGTKSFKQINRLSQFTNSEFFVSAGGTDPPAPVPGMSVQFDFKYDGALNSDRDQNFYLIDDNGDKTAMVLRFSTTVTDSGTNAPGNPADDATPGWLWVLDAGANNGDGAWLDVVGPFSAATQCWTATAGLDAAAQHMSLCVDTHGDAGFASPVCLTNLPVVEGPTGRMDWFQHGSSTATGTGSGALAAGVRLDNFYVCETGAPLDCSQYLRPDGSPDTDCDGNLICDSFELEGHDTNNNGVLDYCEGFCNDCNNNWIPDEYDIAQGSVADVNGNDIPDVCEQLDHSTSFEVAEGFTPGELDAGEGMDGWVNRIRGLVTIENTSVGGFPTDGTQWLRIREDPNALGFTMVFSPRLDAAGDGDIERWSWDQLITANGFGSIWVEIGDLCEDFAGSVTGDGKFIFLDPFIAGFELQGEVANTGFEFRGDGNIYAPVQPGTAELLMLENNAQHYYNGTTAGDIAPDFGSPVHANIDVVNTRGAVRGYYKDVQVGTYTETQGSYVPSPDVCPSITVPKGGDRQLWIRIYDFGYNTEFWFDNLKYETFADCDYNGVEDATFLADHPEYDRNADGIPDSCQDCDHDCGAPGTYPYPIAANQVGCLDPCEINAAAPGCNGMGGGESDANANGVPDSCDIDPSLPYIGMFDDPSCECFDNLNDVWSEPDGRCFWYRAGGGSCDADANGVPDEVQIAGGADDCNANGCVDCGEINAEGGTACVGGNSDWNNDGQLDECEPDCNHNGELDWLDLTITVSQDVQPHWPVGDGIPDECCLSTPGGDLDGDGDVDLDDFSFMQECTGPVAGAASTDGSGVCTGCQCGCADLNEDGVVDGVDAQLFYFRVTGPQ